MLLCEVVVTAHQMKVNVGGVQVQRQVDMECHPGMSVCRQNMKLSKADVWHVCEQASMKEAGTE